MSKSNQTKYFWQKIMGIFAIVSAVNTISTEAIANPHKDSGLYLAQVGVRSRINAPTPLNLRPRNHIPLPRSNRRSRYNRYHDYRYRDRRYSEYNNDYYRDRRSSRDYHCQHRSDYDCDISGHRHDDYYDRRSRKRRNRGSITIYF